MQGFRVWTSEDKGLWICYFVGPWRDVSIFRGFGKLFGVERFRHWVLGLFRVCLFCLGLGFVECRVSGLVQEIAWCGNPKP